MKRNILLILAFTLLGAFACAAWVEVPLTAPDGHHHPESSIEISLFYDSLAPYGDWFWVDPWGWVWTPWDIEPGWRPYTHGHWAWTAFGWAWVADEPWGWAPFHYGRWTYHSHHGWVWVPDTVWAPAWVAWRSGHGWIGWAPLPPHARWRAGIGLDLGGLDLTLGIVQHGWCFVPDRHFHEPHVWRRLEPLPRHQRLLRDTADRTRYEDVDRRVAVRSIPVEEIERNAGPVRRIPLDTLQKPPAAKPPAVRPPAQDGTPAQPPPSLDKEPPERREAREQRELRAWEREQRQRLERGQVQERRQPPAEGNVEERERRQQEERRALQKEVEREKQLVESRRERRAAQAKEKEKTKDMDKARVQEKPRKPAKPPER